MAIKEQPVTAPASNEVLVATRISAISAGTELLVFKGLFPEQMAVDATISSLAGRFHYPLAYGYSCVGEVVATGPHVDPGWTGRRVFAFHPHESHFSSPPMDLIPIPPGISMEDAVFLAGMETAVNLVMDGRPLIGEHGMVFGLGIIGLLTTALLARFPLASLSGVDRLTLRRKTAESFGAGRVFAGTEIEGESGVDRIRSGFPADGKADLIFELTGNPEALNSALSWSGFDTRIIIGSWYGGKSAVIDLGGHFHRNRVKIASSQVSTIAPHLSGRWTQTRRLQTAWKMVQELRPSTLITHRFDITQAQRAFDLLAVGAPDVLQFILVYPSS